MFGWWWQQVVGTYRCSVCGRAIHDGDNYYTPRNPDDEQIVTIERLFRVDPLPSSTTCAPTRSGGLSSQRSTGRCGPEGRCGCSIWSRVRSPPCSNSCGGSTAST